MSPLRKQLEADLAIRGMSDRTREAYVGAVAALAKHYGRSPDRISQEETQRYLLHLLTERKPTPSSCNVAERRRPPARRLLERTSRHPRREFTAPAGEPRWRRGTSPGDGKRRSRGAPRPPFPRRGSHLSSAIARLSHEFHPAARRS